MLGSIVKKTRNRLADLKKSSYPTTKRMFDIAVSSTALIVVSPILIGAAIAIKLEDNGPVIFKQRRSGVDGKPFDIYKFRSMKVKQDEKYNKSRQNEYDSWTNGVPDNFVFKSDESNPNITKVGKFIRKTSIDEFPQFFNVLKGDMSVVGPRPENVIITAKYNDEQNRRLEVKPGITGWAQVNGRDDILHSLKMAYDIEYVEKANFWFDLKIFFMTIIDIFSGRSAY